MDVDESSTIKFKLLISISSIPKIISSYPDFEKVILFAPSISIEKIPLSSDDVSDFSVLIRTKLMVHLIVYPESLHLIFEQLFSEIRVE